MAPKRLTDPPIPDVRIVPRREIRAYVILEDELQNLANGSTSALYLSFSLALLGIACGFFIALVATPIPSNRVFYGFLTSCLVASIIGALLLALWWRSYESAKDLTKRIRNQMVPNAAIQERSTDPEK